MTADDVSTVMYKEIGRDEERYSVPNMFTREELGCKYRRSSLLVGF